MKNIQIGCKAIHKFAKIIKFFSKYSNELFFNAKPVGLEVKVTNQSETTVRIIKILQYYLKCYLILII